MLILAWAVLFIMLAIFFDDFLGTQQNPNQDPSSQVAAGSIEVVLKPNSRHHYVVNGQINGHASTFLLDTGASDVVIPKAVADKMGLTAGRAKRASTANGTITVYSTRLDQLDIGKIKLRDIEASINPSMDGQFILLGMSALKQIEFSQQGDSLILRQ